MRRDESAPKPQAVTRSHYAPDELCVVVTIGGIGAEPVQTLTDDEHDDLCAQLADHLTDLLPTLAPKMSGAASRDDPFARDLAPVTVIARDNSRVVAVRPLGRFSPSMRQGTPLRP